MGVRADLRSDFGACRNCGQPLGDGAVVRRRQQQIRSGEHIGARGEYIDLRCACGGQRQILWAVDMAPVRASVR